MLNGYKRLIKLKVYLFQDYKKNFLRLSRIVLIGGPDDGVITPWESRYCFHIINEIIYKKNTYDGSLTSDFKLFQKTLLGLSIS